VFCRSEITAFSEVLTNEAHRTLVYQTRHAASLLRSYNFSDTPTATWKKVVCRQVLVQLTSGSPFNNLRNKLQAENRDSQVISISQQQQINSVNNRVCLLFCASHTCTLWEDSVLDDQLVSASDDGFQCKPQGISSSAAVL